MGCEVKYELTEKRCQEGIFLSEVEVFGQEKGVHKMICYISDFRSSEILRGKMEIFSLKKVKSAPGLRQ